MMTQKAIVFTQAYKAELLEEPIPEPGVGEVLVKLAVSTISSGTERANLIGDVNVSIARDASPVPVFPRRGGYIPETGGSGSHVLDHPQPVCLQECERGL